MRFWYSDFQSPFWTFQNSDLNLLQPPIIPALKDETASPSPVSTIKTRDRRFLQPSPQSLWISGVKPSSPLVWTGITRVVCYNLPANVNPKQLRLYSGDGSSGVYWIGAISSGATLALPTAIKSCVNMTISSGLPVGTYTLVLEDSTTRTPRFAARVNTATAYVYFSYIFWTNTFLDVTAKWSIDPAHAAKRDKMEVFRPGKLFDWTYTHCKCKTAPTPNAVAKISGNYTFRLSRATCPRSGLTVRLVSAYSNVTQLAALGFNWINWAQLCGVP